MNVTNLSNSIYFTPPLLFSHHPTVSLMASAAVLQSLPSWQIMNSSSSSSSSYSSSSRIPACTIPSQPSLTSSFSTKPAQPLAFDVPRCPECSRIAYPNCIRAGCLENVCLTLGASVCSNQGVQVMSAGFCAKHNTICSRCRYVKEDVTPEPFVSWCGKNEYRRCCVSCRVLCHEWHKQYCYSCATLDKINEVFGCADISRIIMQYESVG